MGLEADVRAAADDIKDARDVIVADSGTLHAIAHGPATGTGSLVATESGNVRTAARAIEELGSGSSYLLKTFANAEGILGEAHGGTGGTDFGAAVADAMSTSFQVLARTYNQGNDAEARDDLGVGVVVKSATQAAPPTSPATGDTYLVPAGATGAWAGQAGKRARWASPTAGQWNFRTPTRGWSVWADDTNTLWEYDSAGWSASLAGGSAPAVYSPLDGRIAGIGKTNGHGGGAKFTVRWTADGRILVCGATSVLGIDSAGANWGQYTVNWPRTANGTIQAIYVGFDYFLIRTNKATGNLFFCGVAGNAQGGQSNTTTQATPVAIAYFASMTVVDVVTEATHYTSGSGTQARFWFARTSDGRLHGCGAGANNTMGVSITTDRGLPQVIADAGGTPLENIAGVACFSVYAPVYAWTTDGKCWVWGAGTSGAHGQGSTANLTSPVLLGGSANPWTGITKAAVTGSNISNTFAVAAIIQNGKVKVAGSQYYGIGNGAALSSGALTAFADATGAIAAETAVDIVAGGGEHATLGARTAAGSAWLCGYQATNANLGDNTVTNRNVFQKATLPSGLDGNVTKIRFGGGNTYNFTVIEANVGGTLQLCAAGYGANGQLGYGIFSPYNGSFSGVANALYAITDWAIVGDYAASALQVLTDDGRDRACGANDVGQLGTQPGNLHNVPILQPCTNETRLLKGPTPHADTSWSSTTTYSFNDLVPYQGSVWRCRVTTSLDVAPPSLPTTLNSDWQCWSQKGDTGAAGANGTNGTNGINGANGAGYGGTSTTSATLGTGAKALNIEAGKAYVSGERIRAACVSGFMEGTVTAYDAGSGALAFNVAATSDVSGTGTFAAWTVGIAGLPGTGGTSPGGVNGSVQINLGGILGAAAKLTYDTALDALSYAKQSGHLIVAPGFTTAGMFSATVDEGVSAANELIGGKYAHAFFGFNVDVAGGRIDNTKASLFLSLATNHHAHQESAGVYRRAANIGIGGYTVEGTPWNLFSFECTETDAANGSKTQGYFACDTITFRNMKQTFDILSLNYAAKTLTLGNGAKISVLQNNVGWAQQLNAAGTGTVTLPYIGNFDQFIMPGGLQASGAHVNYGGGNVVYWSLVPTGATNNGRGIALESYTAVTGSYAPMWVLGNASSRVECYVRNTHATGQAAFTADAYGGGDSVFKFFSDAQSTKWTGGIDASVTGRPFVIAKADTLGTAATDYLTITGNGGLVVGPQVALATNATDGFLYVPSSAGAPTGTPTAYTGKVPIEVDDTNNKIWAYVGGAWKYAALT